MPELARLIRYVEPGVMPGPNLVSIFDPTQNLLLVNREHFDKLTDLEKLQVLHTTKTSLTVSEGDGMLLQRAA